MSLREVNQFRNNMVMSFDCAAKERAAPLRTHKM